MGPMAPHSAAPSAPSLSWTPAEDGYDLALDGTVNRAAGVRTRPLAEELERWRNAGGSVDLTCLTAEKGKTLRQRLTIYPEYATKPDPWIAGKMQAPVAALAGDDGYPRSEELPPEPIAWQDPEVQWKPRSIALTARCIVHAISACLENEYVRGNACASRSSAWESTQAKPAAKSGVARSSSIASRRRSHPSPPPRAPRCSSRRVRAVRG